MQISRNIMILILLGLLLLGAVGYLILTGSKTGPGVSGSAPQSDAEALFLGLTSEIDSLQFDTSILTDPRFKTLVDIHTTVYPEAAGRRDPFASLGGAAPAKK